MDKNLSSHCSKSRYHFTTSFATTSFFMLAETSDSLYHLSFELESHTASTLCSQQCEDVFPVPHKRCVHALRSQHSRIPRGKASLLITFLQCAGLIIDAFHQLLRDSSILTCDSKFTFVQPSWPSKWIYRLIWQEGSMTLFAVIRTGFLL